MATTSPDNIRTPDPTSPYNLTTDFATLASDVQDAITRRGNLYIGTSVQRTAMVDPPVGTHWQDTNGDQREYVYRNGGWRGVTPLLGEVSLTAPSGGGTVSTTVTFPTGYFDVAPVVFLTSRTGAGPTVTFNYYSIDETTTSVSIRMSRSNSTTTFIKWVAIPTT